MNLWNLVVLLSFFARSSAASTVSMASVLKTAIQTQKEDAHWTPWQKRLIETEVLPLAALFLQDVDMTRDGVHAKLDWELLDKYLSHWGPKYWQKKKPVLLTDVASRCGAVCQEKEDALIKALLRSLERRGYIAEQKPHGNHVGTFKVHLGQQIKAGSTLFELEARWKWQGPLQKHKVLQQGSEESILDLFRRLMFEVWTQKIQGNATHSLERVPSSSASSGGSSAEEWGLVAMGLKHYNELSLVREALVRILTCEDTMMRGFSGHRAFFVCQGLGEQKLRTLAIDPLKHGLVVPFEGRTKTIHLEVKSSERWHK